MSEGGRPLSCQIGGVAALTASIALSSACGGTVEPKRDSLANGESAGGASGGTPDASLPPGSGGSQGPGAGGAAGGGGAPAPSGGSAGLPASGGAPAGGTSNAGGATPIDAGPAGNDAMAGTGGVPPVSGPEPVIPEPNGECPDFTAGAQMIMGLWTEMVVGTPGPTKGPLLLAWHGEGAGDAERAIGQVPESVQQDILARGGLIIAPSDNGSLRDGEQPVGPIRTWFDVADVALADHVVACAVRDHNIDPRRIYATGCSMGGVMAGVLGLLRSNYVAAIAPNSGGVYSPEHQLQDPTRVPVLMTMHGGENEPDNTGWGRPSDKIRDLQERLTAAGSVMVVECNHGIGTCQAPETLHENAWEFMMAHPFGINPSPYAEALPGHFPDYCELQRATGE